MLFPRRGNRQTCCLWGGPEKYVVLRSSPTLCSGGARAQTSGPRWSFPFFPPPPPAPRLTDTVTVAFMPKLSPSLCVLDPWVFQSGQFAITSFRTPSRDARVEVSPALCWQLLWAGSLQPGLPLFLFWLPRETGNPTGHEAFAHPSPLVFLGFTSVSENLVCLKRSVSLSLRLHLWAPECLSICGFPVWSALGSRFLGRSLKHPRPPASAPWSLRLCFLSLPALPGGRCPFGLSGPLGRGVSLLPSLPTARPGPGRPPPSLLPVPSLPTRLPHHRA